jgi:hypothetical protein
MRRRKVRSWSSDDKGGEEFTLVGHLQVASLHHLTRSSAHHGHVLEAQRNENLYDYILTRLSAANMQPVSTLRFVFGDTYIVYRT